MSVDRSVPIKYLGFWKRALARLLDVLIAALPGAVLYTLAARLSVMSGTVLPFVCWIAAVVGLIVCSTVLFGGSPGKLILKARIVDAYGRYLTPIRAISRCFFYMLYLIVLALILQQALNLDVTGLSVNRYLNMSGETFRDLRSIVLDLTLLDQLVIAFNSRKRSLHDLIAGSYVVSLSSVGVMRNQAAQHRDSVASLEA